MTQTQTPAPYAVRPADRKLRTLQDVITEAAHEQQLSAERAYVFGDMRAVADAGSVKLASARGAARFTHWSFGQLARMIGAPASYLRELPATTAAQCINDGLHEMNEPSTDAVLLVRAPNGEPEPIIRSVTTKTHGRLWDAQLYTAVQELIGRHPGWELESATRSDRDSVITISNKRAVLRDPSVKQIVNDPNASAGDIMYRSLTVGSSETGAGSVWYEGGLFRARCKNLMLWSSVIESRYRRRHVGSHVLRDVTRELSRFAVQYLEQSPERDEAVIRQLITREVASTKDGVIAVLRQLGMTAEAANSSYAACEMYEPAELSPRSYWGIAQGITRQSQQSAYTDDRLELDRIAAQVLQRGARALVAA